MQVTKDNLDSAFRVIEAIGRREVKLASQSEPVSRERFQFRVFIIAALLPFCVALGLQASRRWLGAPAWLSSAALIFLAITYLGILIHWLIVLLSFGVNFVKVQKDPLSPILVNARMCADSDRRYLQHLHRHHIDILNYVLLELRAERVAFEKRIRLIIGAVEKLGILPGLLAFMVMLSHLGNPPQPYWVYSIAYATPVLYFTGLEMHKKILRGDRIIMLLERVIETKQDSPNNSLKPDSGDAVRPSAA